MNTLIVSYDLGVPETGKDYSKIKDYMDTHHDWMKPLQSFWVLKTTKSASEVRDDLTLITDSNDKILVFKVDTKAWASNRLSESANKWLKANMISS